MPTATAAPEIQLTREQFAAKHPDFKATIDGRPYVLADCGAKGTCLVPVQLVDEPRFVIAATVATAEDPNFPAAVALFEAPTRIAALREANALWPQPLTEGTFAGERRAIRVVDASPVLREICGWCKAVVVEGDAGAPVTHGICPTCAANAG